MWAGWGWGSPGTYLSLGWLTGPPQGQETACLFTALSNSQAKQEKGRGLGRGQMSEITNTTVEM